MSALAIPMLLPVAGLALILMGRRRAAWWIVPVLWPSTQWYYASLVMPADDAAGRDDRGRRQHPRCATMAAESSGVALTVCADGEPADRRHGPPPVTVAGATTRSHPVLCSRA